LICPNSSEAIIISELRGKEVYFTAKLLAAVGCGWPEHILK
jgi:hypothetical protein